jgi:methenyltetrahydromethanopterin cyclohydrolase
MTGSPSISVNRRAAVLVENIVTEAAELRIVAGRGALGERVIDAGSQTLGSIAAGLRIAEICMGGLGTLQLLCDTASPDWPWKIAVHSSDPVTACLASQYAGWKLSEPPGKPAFVALGSGPARALAQEEALFSELGYRDRAPTGTLVLESNRPPPVAIVHKVARACGLNPSDLTFIYAPTQSLAGTVQIVARVLEVALHKAHQLKFPLERIVDGMGAAPLCPPHPDFVCAMGRTNDAIIFAGQVQLFVTGPQDDAQALAEHLPSAGSRDYGRPFAETFRKVGGDFYAIDPMLFAPAEVIVTALNTGKSYRRGNIDLEMLNAAFA